MVNIASLQKVYVMKREQVKKNKIYFYLTIKQVKTWNITFALEATGSNFIDPHQCERQDSVTDV